ncbi:MAG: hypothetical protein NTY26_03295 [Burkholderiales bacterium]|nr:hypothetical protein [Burkholderiales bacterium]
MISLIDHQVGRIRIALRERGLDKNTILDLRPSRSGVELQLRTVRTQGQKLTLDLISGAGEMYDLLEDPFEMDNRFGDPAMAAMQKELTDMIASRPDDAVAPLPQIGMA